MRFMLKQIYIDSDVLTETKKRISRLFDDWENIIVSISGGKDSTVVAHLTLQEAHKRGRRVGLFFLDEEVVYESTVNQIRYLMGLYPENTIKYWLQIEFNLTNATSLMETQLKCWERGKSDVWMRPKEPDSIRHKPWDVKTETVANKVKGFGFYDAIDNFQRCMENTCFILGIRGVESPNRMRAVMNHPGYSDVFWTTKTKTGVSAYPLYDWNFHDIWKYIYDNDLKYSKIYDYQHKKGLGLQDIRVSSLIHEKSFKALVDLPEFEPRTYDRLLKRIDGISIGNLYGRDPKLLKCRRLPKNYKSWMEYRDFLMETYPDKDKKYIFEKRFAKHLNNNYVARQECRQLLLNDYENNLTIDNKDDPRRKTLEKWRDIL